MQIPRYEHSDIRKNPELQEWFCAKCGAASDHTLREDAIVELSGFECSLHGATTKKLNLHHSCGGVLSRSAGFGVPKTINLRLRILGSRYFRSKHQHETVKD